MSCAGGPDALPALPYTLPAPRVHMRAWRSGQISGRTPDRLVRPVYFATASGLPSGPTMALQASRTCFTTLAGIGM